jgi:hypothetical protein
MMEQRINELNRAKRLFCHTRLARQSGKTTLLKGLARKINAEGKYYALYCSLEKIQGITEAKEAMPHIIDVLKMVFYSSNIPKGELFAKESCNIGFASLLQFELSKVSKILDKPLVIFFDEADCLSNGTLITFLRNAELYSQHTTATGQVFFKTKPINVVHSGNPANSVNSGSDKGMHKNWHAFCK